MVHRHDKFSNNDFANITPLQNERGIGILWSCVMDAIFHSSAFDLVGGEITSPMMRDLFSSSAGLYKYDGLIVSRSDIARAHEPIEFGYQEIKKQSANSNQAKFMFDHFKIIQGMVISLFKQRNWKNSIRLSIMLLGTYWL